MPEATATLAPTNLSATEVPLKCLQQHQTLYRGGAGTPTSGRRAMVVDDLLQTYFPEKAAKLPYGDPVPLRQFAQNNSGIPDYANDIIMGCFP